MADIARRYSSGKLQASRDRTTTMLRRNRLWRKACSEQPLRDHEISCSRSEERGGEADRSRPTGDGSLFGRCDGSARTSFQTNEMPCHTNVNAFPAITAFSTLNCDYVISRSERAPRHVFLGEAPCSPPRTTSLRACGSQGCYC